MKSWHYLTLGVLIGIITAGILLLVILAPRGEALKLQEKDAPTSLSVHIAGAVKNPGVYELDAGSRVVDAVNAAGGFLEDADQRQVNLAEVIQDGRQIYIPIEGESPVVLHEIVPTGITAGSISMQININTASQQDLEQLPGVGPAKAADIIAYRDENGQFLTIEDIMNVPGIGPGLFENMEDLITVE